MALANAAGQFTGTTFCHDIYWCAGASRKVVVGDFGGTSATDLLCHSSSGKKWMSFGGSGTFAGTSRQWDMQWCYGVSNRLLVGDFNGDGVSDMLCHDVNSGNKWISYQKR